MSSVPLSGLDQTSGRRWTCINQVAHASTSFMRGPFRGATTRTSAPIGNADVLVGCSLGEHPHFRWGCGEKGRRGRSRERRRSRRHFLWECCHPVGIGWRRADADVGVPGRGEGAKQAGFLSGARLRLSLPIPANRGQSYLAISTDRTSRISVTFTSPGYVSSFSIFLAMSRAILLDTLSSTILASTITRISRPAWMAYA